jgi:phytol kinase
VNRHRQGPAVALCGAQDRAGAVLRSLAGLVLSYVFVFGLLALATLLIRRGFIAASAARKVIHIGVSHWWLLAMAMFSDPWIASVGPLSFIFINALDLRFRLMKAMDAASNPHNLGTVFYPVSLLVLVNICWRGLIPIWVGGIGVLIMGWGDGLAAVVGETVTGKGLRIWRGRKTLAGTCAMFAASFAVTMAFTLAFNAGAGLLHGAAVAAAVAAFAATVELLTPLGIDNLTVPLLTPLFYAAVFL